MEKAIVSGTENTQTHIPVLNKGYVRYVDHMGSDLSVTAAARASFDKVSTEWNEKEERLLKFLIREGHTSTLRHATMSLEIYAPLIVARQWWKHVVASSHLDDQVAHNESSRRYITEEPEFYLPAEDEWRSAPENRKQGSGPVLDSLRGDDLTGRLTAFQEEGLRLYNMAMSNGVAPEQARLFLPAYGLMVRWRWTFSLGAGLHFLHQRLAHDAQSEIRDYAVAVKDILAERFPVAVETTLEGV